MFHLLSPVSSLQSHQAAFQAVQPTFLQIPLVIHPQDLLLQNPLVDPQKTAHQTTSKKSSHIDSFQLSCISTCEIPNENPCRFTQSSPGTPRNLGQITQGSCENPKGLNFQRKHIKPLKKFFVCIQSTRACHVICTCIAHFPITFTRVHLGAPRCIWVNLGDRKSSKIEKLKSRVCVVVNSQRHVCHSNCVNLNKAVCVLLSTVKAMCALQTKRHVCYSNCVNLNKAM